MNATRTIPSRARFVAFAVACVCLLIPRAASAAAADDSRWQPWLGCWSATPPRFVDLAAEPQEVCVVPAAGTSAVDLVTVNGSRIVSREHIDASGERRPAERDGCTGWESAVWSADMRRVYLQSESTCSGGARRTTSALMTMAANGDWVDIVGVAAGDRVGVRVLHHRAAAPLPTLPAEIASAVAPRHESATLRTLLPIGDAEIIDASRHLNGAVIEAWLADNRQAFTINAKRLAALADAGVDDRVLDMLVALSYPEVFSLRPSPTAGGALAMGGGGQALLLGGGPLVSGGYLFDCNQFYPVNFYGLDACSPYFGSGYYGPYGPWGYYGDWGWYGSGGGGIVIVPTPPSSSSHGQVVNGKGYASGSASSGGSSGGSSGSSGSSGGSSGGGSSASSGGGRTAVPR